MKKIATAVIEHLLCVKSVALLMHVNPDWDCLGSCMALREVLRDRGIVCDIFADEPLSPYLSAFGSDAAKVYKDGDFDGYACLCCVDVGDSGRIGRRADAFSRHPDTACIDHHVGDGSFARISYVDSSAPAAGEIVYDMLKSTGIAISDVAAGYIYCAISADTGSFKYAATTSHTMAVAGEIMDMGVNTAALCDLIYGRKTLKQLKLQGEAISTLKLHCGGRIGTAYVSEEMYKKYNADKNDTEALAALPREIDTVVMSGFFTWRSPDEIRVNLRAKGEYDVRSVAAVFGGGGHMRAAGCTVKGHDMEAAVEAVVKELEKQL